VIHRHNDEAESKMHQLKQTVAASLDL